MALLIDSRVGVGIANIVRDAMGQVLGSLASGIVHVMDPLFAKAEEALQAVIFGLQMGLTKVILEGDSLTIINKLCSQKEDLSIVRAIILDIKLRSFCFFLVLVST
ncbi:hypothetical protein PTKIN_Ptkin02bG0100300 [Pterospermum kingtungense]